ncbi:hypothetical protein HQ590_08210, partial [bacterium]|nr:hypothetical protein [bacterium]
MTNRERFRRLMNYETVDRLPVMAFEPYEETLLARWRQDGLPPTVTPQDHFGLDQFCGVPIDFTARPPFDTQVITEDAEYRVQLDWMGTTVRRFKKAPTMYYGHIDHPVKTRADWEHYRQRFVPDLAARLPADWPTEGIRRLRESTDPVSLCPFPFFFRLGFYAMGMDRFLTAFHDEPDLIHDMFAYWADFVETLIRPVLA